MDTYYFKFSQLPGDLINFLPGIKHVCERDNKKAVIMLGLDIEWQSPWAQTRKDKSTLTMETMDSLKPLLLSQDYIEDVVSWQEVDKVGYSMWCSFFKMLRTPGEIMEFHNQYFKHIVDLDKIYLVPNIIPHGNIHRWPWYCYPDMACNLAEPWLFVEPDEGLGDYIVVNRTLRARNKNIDYSFLKPFQDKIMFVGLVDEWIEFCKDNDMEVRHHQASDILTLATIIRSSRFFIGNQSLCFALAEAMKVPRILEVCPELPNVVPSGDKAYDALFTSTMEYYFNELNK
jgi:hypothetical protein